MAENFVCPTCGFNHYSHIGATHSVPPEELYRCDGCTTMFTDPDKFAAVAKRPEKLAGIFFQSAASGFKELIEVFRKIEGTPLLK